MIQAAALVREHQSLAKSLDLYETAETIPGVVEAYPTLGSHDGVIFVRAETLRDLRGVLHHVESLAGVDDLETLVEDESIGEAALAEATGDTEEHGV